MLFSRGGRDKSTPIVEIQGRSSPAHPVWGREKDNGSTQILKVPAHLFDILPITFGIAVIQKFIIPVMNRF